MDPLLPLSIFRLMDIHVGWGNVIKVKYPFH
jgi:hypothetical protein